MSFSHGDLHDEQEGAASPRTAIAGRVTNRQVATALGVSVRHAARLKLRFREGGAVALRHRSRGQPSPRRLPRRTRETVIRLTTTTYVGFSDTHLTEKLQEIEGLTISLLVAAAPDRGRTP